MKKPLSLSFLKRRFLRFSDIRFRLLSSPWRMLPDFIVIGGQKCGSTSLYNYIKQHPNVIPANKKAASFFDGNYYRGFNWYRSHFPLARYSKAHNPTQEHYLTGEATASYIFHPLAPARIAEVLPQAKIIALLRNPISRSYSHYHHMLRTGRETLAFEDALDQEAQRMEGVLDRVIAGDNKAHKIYRNFSYLARGRYAEQLERWFTRFPPKQFLILKSENFFQDPTSVCVQVHKFLGLSEWDLGSYKNYNPGGYPPMKPETHQWLSDYFKPYNEDLYAMLGVDFDW